MAHTTHYGKWTAFHNRDPHPNGDVTFVRHEAGPTSEDMPQIAEQVSVPMGLIVEIVSELVADAAIAKIEQMGPTELLGLDR